MNYVEKIIFNLNHITYMLVTKLNESQLRLTGNGI